MESCNGSRERVRLDGMSKMGKSLFMVFWFGGIVCSICFAVLGFDAIESLPPSDGVGTGFNLTYEVFGHGFMLNNLYSNYLELSMKPYPNEKLFDGKELYKDVYLRITLDGVENGEHTSLADQVVHRDLHCFRQHDNDEPYCADTLIFSESYIRFDYYYFTVSVPEEHRDSFKVIETVDFVFTKETVDFAVWRLRINYAMLAISFLAILYWYFSSLNYLRVTSVDDDDDEKISTGSSRRATCFPFRTPNQRWIFFLLMAVLFYNQPFYAFQFLDNDGWRQFFVTFGVMLQLFGVSLFLLFWLIAFDSLSNERIPVKPKLLFTFIFWFVLSTIYAIVVGKKNTDKLYNWETSSTLMSVLSLFLFVSGMIYFVWLIIASLRVSGEMRQLSYEQRLVYANHTFHMSVVIGSIIFGMFFHEDPRRTKATIFYQMFINFYVLGLVFLYTPVRNSQTTTPTDADQEAPELGAQVATA